MYKSVNVKVLLINYYKLEEHIDLNYPILLSPMEPKIIGINIKI